MYYDAPGQRVAFFEETFEGGEETAAYNEYFFHKQVGYNRTLYVSKFPSPF